MRNQVSHGETNTARQKGRYLLRSLVHGFEVLEQFGEAPRGLTLMDVAGALGRSKATTFRYLASFVALGYLEVEPETRRYKPTVKVLRLGGAYLASLTLPDLALPHLDGLARAFGESVNLGVLDDVEIVYVARVSGERILLTNLTVGSRLPAQATSMGKVLLAYLPEAAQRRALSRIAFKALTPRTATSATRVREVLRAVRRQGYAVNDQELDLGLRSCAAPVFDRRGDAIASVNLSTSTARVTLAQMESRYVPAVVATARQISEVLKTRY
jgi:IclR family transcriptional regulator, pca regulon regulatory protein